MTAPTDGQAATIDCYQADFPKSDPHSARSFARIVASSFDHEIPSFAQATPFSARSEIFCLPDVTVSRTRSTSSRFTRTMKRIAADGADQVLVVCYTAGHFTMTAANRTRRVEARELAFIDLTQETVIEAPSVANVSLAISRRRLETMVPFLDDVHGFVRNRDALSYLLRGVIEDVVATGPTISIIDARAISTTIIQLAASCLEPLSRQHFDTTVGRNAVSLVHIKAFIEKRLPDPDLRLQTLLDEFGIARSTLYRLFDPVGGVSAYITRRKLHHAFRLLGDTVGPRQRISKLAFDLGFSHPSAFTRAFKDQFGLSPKDVQALAAQSKEREVQLMSSPDIVSYLSPILRPTRDTATGGFGAPS